MFSPCYQSLIKGETMTDTAATVSPSKPVTPESVRANGLHHLAFATKCSEATYDFYHNKLGMPLKRTENHRQAKGYFKHYFFDMGRDQCMAFFELHGVGETKDYRTDVSTGLGMPLWINHVAFDIENETHYQAMKTRLKEKKVTLLGEADHGWCKSLYLVDPNMIMLEFTYTTVENALEEQGHDGAYQLLFDTDDADIGEETRKKAKRVD